jgi:hypothetical protein
MTTHQPGDEVHVLDGHTGKWRRATIERKWSCVTIPEGKRTYEYEATGKFRDSDPWYGTFDAEHVRAIPPRKKKKVNYWCRKHPKPCEGIGPDCVHW